MKAFNVLDGNSSRNYIKADSAEHALVLLREELARGFEPVEVESLMEDAKVLGEVDLSVIVENEDGKEVTLAEALEGCDPGVFWCDEW